MFPLGTWNYNDFKALNIAVHKSLMQSQFCARSGPSKRSGKVSLTSIHWKSLQYLGAEKWATVFICMVNIALALTMLIEPVLVGVVIQAIATKSSVWLPLSQ